MPTIQDADFHHLKIMNSIRELDTHVLPIGSAGTKIIFDHPLPKTFVRNWGAIINAVLVSDGYFLRPRSWHNAIDHGIRKSAIRNYPIGQRLIRHSSQRNNSLAQYITVTLQ